MKRKVIGLIFVIALLLTACTVPEVSLNEVVAPEPTELPVEALPEATEPAPLAEPVEAPATEEVVAIEEPSATDEPIVEVSAESTLLNTDWNDRTPFASGLINSEQSVLDELDGATTYQIQLSLSDDLTQLSGQQQIHYTNNEDVVLDAVLLRLFPNLADGNMIITAVTANGEPVEPALSLEDSVLAVTLAQQLEPGDSVVLDIAYDVTIPTDGGGNYGTFAYRDDVLALAHFYPMVAVFDDEGWNVEIAPESGDVVYADSSFYLVELDLPADVVVAASGVEIGRNTTNDRQTITYAAGPMRDFYIAASRNFEPLSTQIGETTINSYTFPEFAAANAQVLQYAADAVESFNTRYGTYPFTELDLVSTPTDALGVEYPGIIVNTLRMYDLENPSYPPSYLESTTAHEVAHQWFYSIVGNDQLDEPWLDESVTQFATMMYFFDQYGEQGRDGYRDSLNSRWSRANFAEIPVGQPVAAYTPSDYSAIVYGRGPLFVEQLESEMGIDVFAEFMQAYVADNKFGIASTQSFQDSAESACNCDLSALFEQWIYAD